MYRFELDDIDFFLNIMARPLAAFLIACGLIFLILYENAIYEANLFILVVVCVTIRERYGF